MKVLCYFGVGYVLFWLQWKRERDEAAWCERWPCGRMCVWVSSIALSPAGCVTNDGSHRRGTGWCVGGMCHPHHSQVVSAVEALDFRGPWCCCCTGRGYICLHALCLKQCAVRRETQVFLGPAASKQALQQHWFVLLFKMRANNYMFYFIGVFFYLTQIFSNFASCSLPEKVTFHFL